MSSTLETVQQFATSYISPNKRKWEMIEPSCLYIPTVIFSDEIDYHHLATLDCVDSMQSALEAIKDAVMNYYNKRWRGCSSEKDPLFAGLNTSTLEAFRSGWEEIEKCFDFRVNYVVKKVELDLEELADRKTKDLSLLQFQISKQTDTNSFKRRLRGTKFYQSVEQPPMLDNPEEESQRAAAQSLLNECD